MKKFNEYYYNNIENIDEVKNILTNDIFRFNWTGKLTNRFNVGYDVITVAERKVLPGDVVRRTSKYTKKGTLRKGGVNIYTKPEEISYTKLVATFDSVFRSITIPILNTQIIFCIDTLMSVWDKLDTNQLLQERCFDVLLRQPLFYLGEEMSVFNYNTNTWNLDPHLAHINRMTTDYNFFNTYVDCSYTNRVTRSLYTAYKHGYIRGADFIKAHQRFNIPLDRNDIPEEMALDLMY